MRAPRKSRTIPKELHKKRGPTPRPVGDRIAERTAKTESGCVEWLGPRDSKGYGRIGIPGQRSALVHRIAWTLANGKIPEGLNVLHRCDNPPCCNPDHLFLGTLLDNNADMYAKGRHSRGEKHSPFVRGENNSMSLLTEEKVREIRAAKGLCIDLAKRFGVHYTTISDVRRRKSWRHVA